MKAFIIALPVSIAALLFLFWATYKFGKRIGVESVDRVGNKKRDQLLGEADGLFHDLLVTTDLDTDDIITQKTRTRIGTWRRKFEGD
jgi:hypothetical protein